MKFGRAPTTLRIFMPVLLPLLVPAHRVRARSAYDERALTVSRSVGRAPHNGETDEAIKWYEKGMVEAKKAGDNHAFGELRGAYEELTF